MPGPDELHAIVEHGVRTNGFVRVAGLNPADYRALALALGEIVGDERIALRPGAHAYVAKPGPVPLHTDQPQVEIVSWLCERQDEEDGASLLFDTRPFIERLNANLRRMLRDVRLMTPPLSGGPPTMTWPTLRRVATGDAVFCSPWLRSASPQAAHVEALDTFRRELSQQIRAGHESLRLTPGDALFIDNRRVLHGRAGISAESRRSLLRLWVRRAPAP